MICDKRKCTGCFSCFNICPKNAIEMKKDSYGNIYPHINEKKCINCNLCKKACPQLKENLDFNEPTHAFAMYNKNQKKRRMSTSGGAATTLYEMILDNNGVIYGASNLFGNNEFKFIRIINKKDLYKVKGSKYVHCYINNIFKNIKDDLENNKIVLFIGTPCQVSGLYSFLLKKYDNLITVDIICHGVPSQQLLFDEIKLNNIDYKNVSIVRFRDEKMYHLTIIDNNSNILLDCDSNSNYFFNNFLKGNFFRENCYECRYAQKNRISDITIGDFWGLSHESKIYDDEKKGISLILTNTKKGLELINQINKYSIIEERTLDEACKLNQQLKNPMKKTKEYYIYINNYNKKGYLKTMKKMLSSKEKIKMKIKKVKIANKIYNKLKKV